MKELIRATFELPLQHALTEFASLLCAFEMELEKIPHQEELEIIGSINYALAGDSSESTIKVKYLNNEISFLSCSKSRDNGYRGTESAEWLEANLKGLKLTMGYGFVTRLDVEIEDISSFKKLKTLLAEFNAEMKWSSI